MRTEIRPDVPRTPDAAGDPPAGAPSRRRTVVWLAVAVVTLLVVAVALAMAARDRDAAAEATTVTPDGATVEEELGLSLGEGAALASCLPVDAAILADMPMAFAATATAVEGEQVTLAVDRWYAGGDAGTVVLQAPAGMEALIAGFDLSVGERYLIAAGDGTVNYCGYSGAATPELQAVYDAAFPSAG